MKRLYLLFLALPLAAAEPYLSEQLRDALYTEEVTRDPAAAAVSYEKILADFDTQRPLAATALFRLAEIKRNAGNDQLAISLYQRLLREFPDREAEAKFARQHLASLGGEEPAGGSEPIGEEATELHRLRELAETAPDIILDPQTLDHAVDKGWAQVVAFLLEQGSDLTDTPVLYNAASTGRLDICRLLVAHGVDDRIKNSAIAAAIVNRRRAVLQFLIEDGIDNEAVKFYSYLHRAVEANNPDALTLLLDRGANVDTLIDSPEKNAKLIGTPLHQAVYNNNLEIFELLIKNGAKPDIKTPVAMTTPLHLAISNQSMGSRKMLETLLEMGADPNAVRSVNDESNRTKPSVPRPRNVPHVEIPSELPNSESEKSTLRPLEIARLNNNFKAAEILVNAGANVEKSDIFRVVEINAVRWVELFLKHIPRFEPDDPLGRELLEFALQFSHASATPLIEHGASPSKEQIANHFADAPRDVLPYLNETFLIPKAVKEPRIQLLVDRISGQHLVTLAETSSSQTPPPLAKALLDVKTTYTQLSEGETEDQWLLWRSDESGRVHSIKLDFSEQKLLPELQWGDVIERRIINLPIRYSARELDHLPNALAWQLSRQVHFPIKVTYEGKTRQLTVRGDRISYDPTIAELPYLNANRIVNLLQPELNLRRNDVLITIRRRDWQDTTKKMGSKALTQFMLREDDHLIISSPEKEPDPFSDSRLLDIRNKYVTLQVSDTSYSRVWDAKPAISLIEVISCAYSAESFSWSRDHLKLYSDDLPTRFGQLMQNIANRRIATPIVLPKPDFSSIRIHRLEQSGDRTTIAVDLEKAILTCTETTTPKQARSHDVQLQVGDVVEFTLDKKQGAWSGFSPQQTLFLRKALSGTCQVTAMDGEIRRQYINWQPTHWPDSPAGKLPVPPQDGISCTRVSDLGLNSGSSRQILRNGETFDSIGNAFLRNGDQLTINSSSSKRPPPIPSKTPRVRRVPTPPSR